MRIVCFDIDCLRPDHLGCYGYSRPTSPAIDQIARQGVCFDRYYCSSSPCLPSRTAWASGRFGIRNGVVSNHGAGSNFRIHTRRYGGPHPDNEMFPRHLRKHGYDTFAFSNFADRHNALWFMYGWTQFHTPNLKAGHETAQEVNAALLPWLRQNATRENYFLYVNYWDAHRCYKMDASWADRFRNHPVKQAWPDDAAIDRHQQITGPFTANAQFKDHVSSSALMPGSIRSRADFEHLITGYDAAIAYVDHHLAAVLEVLDQQGVLDETAIIITGDHGDAFGEHGIYSDHVNADECVHRLPLVVRWPGVTTAPGASPSGGSSPSSSLLYNVDFAPTLCDLLGLPTCSQWDGQSFAPAVRGQAVAGRDCLVWDCALYAVQRAVRTRQHLLVQTYDPFGYGTPPIELYDMNADPWQTRDLSHQQPLVVRQCQSLLDEWLDAQCSKPGWVSDPLQAVLAERRRG
jgi:arylsulfatase A-like enzyme